MHFKKRKSLLNKPYGEYSYLAQLQIEKLRLKFLRKCLNLRRPPTSIRIRGASAISDAQKLFHFSCLETKLLGIAIRNKLNLIRNLTIEVSQSNTLEPLPESDARSMSNHLDHKYDFLKKQDSNK